MNETVKITVQAIDQASTILTNVSKQMATIGTAGIGAAIGIAKVYTDIERSLGQTAAVAGWTAKELKEVENVVRSTATTTAADFQGATAAMYDFASAGIDIAENTKLYTDTLNMAVGVGGNFSEAVQLMSASMRQFGIDFSESEKVADAFADAVSGSMATLGKLQASFRQVGAVAGSLDQDFYEIVGSLKELYNQGLQGEQAGTALRAIFARLAAPSGEATAAIRELGLSLEDIDPSKVGLNEIIAQFEKVEPTARQVVQIFGVEAQAAFETLRNAGSQALNELTEASRNAAGQAKEMADRINELDATKIQNMVDTLHDMAFEIGPAVVEALEEMFEPIKRINDEMKEVGVSAGLVKDVIKSFGVALGVAVTGATIGGLKQLIGVFTSIGTAVGMAGVAATGFGAAVAVIAAGNLFAIAKAISIFGEAREIRETSEELHGLQISLSALGQVRAELPPLNDYMDDLAEHVADVAGIAKEQAFDIIVSGKVNPEIVADFNEQNKVTDDIKKGYDDFVKNFQKEFNLSDNAIIDLSSMIEADAEGFIRKMQAVVDSTSDTAAGLRRVSDETEDVVKGQGDAAEEVTKNTVSAINKIWDAAGSPLEDVKQKIETGLSNINELLGATGMKQFGEDFSAILTEKFKMDIAEGELKKKLEDVTRTIYDYTDEIPEVLAEKGRQIDSAWWEDYVSGLVKPAEDIEKLANDVESATGKAKNGIQSMADSVKKINTSDATKAIEETSKSVKELFDNSKELEGSFSSLERKALSTPEIRVVGSNITKYRVEVDLSLNKEKFLEEWRKLGFNMTSNFEKQLIYG